MDDGLPRAEPWDPQPGCRSLNEHWRAERDRAAGDGHVAPGPRVHTRLESRAPESSQNGWNLPANCLGNRSFCRGDDLSFLDSFLGGKERCLQSKSIPGIEALHWRSMQPVDFVGRTGGWSERPRLPLGALAVAGRLSGLDRELCSVPTPRRVPYDVRCLPLSEKPQEPGPEPVASSSAEIQT